MMIRHRVLPERTQSEHDQKYCMFHDQHLPSRCFSIFSVHVRDIRKSSPRTGSKNDEYAHDADIKELLLERTNGILRFSRKHDLLEAIYCKHSRCPATCGKIVKKPDHYGKCLFHTHTPFRSPATRYKSSAASVSKSIRSCMDAISVLSTPRYAFYYTGHLAARRDARRKCPDLHYRDGGESFPLFALFRFLNPCCSDLRPDG
jgi:hypothetical protein